MFGKRDDFAGPPIEIVRFHCFHTSGLLAGGGKVGIASERPAGVALFRATQGGHHHLLRKTVSHVGFGSEAQLLQDLPLDGLQSQLVRLELLPVAVVLEQAVGTAQNGHFRAGFQLVLRVVVPQPLPVRQAARRRAHHQIETQDAQGPGRAINSHLEGEVDGEEEELGNFLIDLAIPLPNYGNVADMVLSRVAPQHLSAGRCGTAVIKIKCCLRDDLQEHC